MSEAYDETVFEESGIEENITLPEKPKVVISSTVLESERVHDATVFEPENSINNDEVETDDTPNDDQKAFIADESSNSITFKQLPTQFEDNTFFSDSNNISEEELPEELREKYIIIEALPGGAEASVYRCAKASTKKRKK